MERPALDGAQAARVAQTFQQPHPRLYLACTSPDSFRLAAQRGIGVLSSTSYAVNVLADLVKIYREELTTAQPVGAFITDFWGNNVHAFCDEDDQYAKDLGGPVDEDLLRAGQALHSGPD